MSEEHGDLISIYLNKNPASAGLGRSRSIMSARSIALSPERLDVYKVQDVEHKYTKHRCSQEDRYNQPDPGVPHPCLIDRSFQSWLDPDSLRSWFLDEHGPSQACACRLSLSLGQY